MAGLLGLIIPALIPSITDAVRGLINRFTGGAGSQPTNVAEAIQLMTAETERMKALAILDMPAGAISPWVADLRASCRYVIAVIVVLNAVVALYWPGMNPVHAELAISLAGSVWAFLFGERFIIGQQKRGR